jgi:hypothetical protein
MPDKFFYLSFTAIYFIIWLSLFCFRKDVRKEMVYLGLIFGMAGVLSELTFIVDWWQPQTITSTRIGVKIF